MTKEVIDTKALIAFTAMLTAFFAYAFFKTLA